MPPRLLFLLAVLLPGLAFAGPGILLFPALGHGGQVVVGGRVLAEAPTSGSSTLSRNLRRLTASGWEGVRVTVTYAGLSQTVTAGSEGAFEVTFAPSAGMLFEPGLGEAWARVPGTSAVARVEVVAETAPFIVISDFDDTLAVTHVLSTRKLLKSALFQDGDTQPVVPGMAAFYQCLRGKSASPPGFALVSGSPVQYVPRTQTFLAKNGFPFFGLYLRDLGPGTLKGYKQPFIRRLLGQLPHRVVLIGDSGEHDPEVYREVSAGLSERVARIYIRDAGRADDPKRFEGMLLFKEAKEAADDAVARGLISAECRDQAFPAGGEP